MEQKQIYPPVTLEEAWDFRANVAKNLVDLVQKYKLPEVIEAINQIFDIIGSDILEHATDLSLLNSEAVYDLSQNGHDNSAHDRDNHVNGYDNPVVENRATLISNFTNTLEGIQDYLLLSWIKNELTIEQYQELCRAISLDQLSPTLIVALWAGLKDALCETIFDLLPDDDNSETL